MVIKGNNKSKPKQQKSLSKRPCRRRQISSHVILRVIVEIGSSLLSAAAPLLAREVNVGMHDPHVPGERVTAGEGLLLRAEAASDFLLAVVVNRVLMASQVV